MFDCLYTVDEELSTRSQPEARPTSRGLDVPPKPRLNCGLAGIKNQGATCYLNALLQTLLFTPEFREYLFRLDETELGKLCSKNASKNKVRIIPLQLQKLFAKLLLSDQQSISTSELTDSFGWVNHEELQQHDVQELNRILFAAIENSLVGTSGRNLIRKLYHGTIVNQIICCQCGRVREREEDFLDLTVTIAGNSSLQDGLHSVFCDVEKMEGKNQYRCENCDKLVDATKGARIRLLPQILTVSLLRFSFDFTKMERYKDTDRISFPLALNMSRYLENPTGQDTEFELFSVVIHRGGAFGGHYHVYIRDIDGLGNWTDPDEEDIRLPTNLSSGEVDFIECQSPVDLIQTLLSMNNRQMTIDKLCSEINKQTGVSWNKRFKKHYGPITKFFEKYSDIFMLDKSNNLITLVSNEKTEHLQPDDKRRSNSPPGDDCAIQEQQIAHVHRDEKHKRAQSTQSALPIDGYHWFDFDDARVQPILEKQLEKQFSGKESAYMLFYRKKSLERPIAAKNNPGYCISDEIISEVLAENDKLEKERQEYETAVNKITVQIHFSGSYCFHDGALQPLPDCCTFIELEFDQRKTIAKFQDCISDVGGELVPENYDLHVMKELPAGLHLYDCISKNATDQLKDLNVGDGCKIFIWNGRKVQTVSVLAGEHCEPLYLTVIHGESSQFSMGFPKNLTLVEFKMNISELTDIPVDHLTMKRVVIKDGVTKAIALTYQDLKATLKELKMKDGDHVLVEDKLLANAPVADQIILKRNVFFVQIENQCVKELDPVDSSSRRTIKFEVSPEYTVGDLKAMALSKFGVAYALKGGRLRVDDETVGLRAPLCDQMNIVEARITHKTNLVLQHGMSPQSNQLTLTFTPGEACSGLPDMELIVDRNQTVGTCLKLMLEKANFCDKQWYLRKTNWCGEAAEILDEPDATLEKSLVYDGDHLLLVRGSLPPKGYFRFPVWFHPTSESLQEPLTAATAMLWWLSSSLQGLMKRDDSAPAAKEEPVMIGDIDISKESTLEEMKEIIMTLDLLADIPLPTPKFLRVRLKVDEILGTVLRPDSTSVQRLKLNSSSVLAVQIMKQEEELSPKEIVLNVKVRIPDSKCYAPAKEFVWNTASGSSPRNLKQAIADALLLPAQHIVLAKHFQQRFEWVILLDANYKIEGTQGKKKKGKVSASNLKQSHYNIKDGDVIGVKDLRFDPNNVDNFCTVEDEEGKEKLKVIAEEKRKERLEKKNRQSDIMDREKRPRRPEVGLTIKVDDFTYS